MDFSIELVTFVPKICKEQMSKSILRTFLVVLLLLVQESSHASFWDTGQLYRSISVDEGLAGLTATDFCMDRDGQLWISTSQGLSLYNGQFVTSFEIPNVSSRKAYCFHVDVNEKGDVYVASGGGLFVLRFGKDKLERLVDHQVLHVKVAGNLIYYGDKEGLHVINGKGKTETLFRCSLEDLSVRCIRVNGNKVWFSLARRFGYYDMQTKKIKVQGITSNSSLTDFSVVGNKAYIGTKSNGLLCYDVSTHQLHEVSAVLGKVINSVKVTGDNLCVGTEGSGAFLLDVKTEQLKEQFSSFLQGRHYIPDNTLSAYLRDEHGIDWFGILSYGLVHSYYARPVFSLFTKGDFSTKGMKVRCFCQDGENILIGTRSGLFYLSGKESSPHYYSPDKFGASTITSIEKLGGKYYVATNDNGLFVLDPVTGNYEHAQGHIFFQSSSFYHEAIAPTGDLWVTGSEGIFVIQPSGKTRLVLVQDKKVRRMPMHGIVFDCYGRAWIGSNAGIILVDSKNYHIYNYKSDAKSFENSAYYKVVKGHHEKIIAYSNDSVRIYDPKTLKYQGFSMPSLVVGEACNAFFDDCQGHYYMSSEKGLFRSDYQFGNVQRLGYMQGLNTSMVASDGIFCSLGHVWFCTSNGLYRLIDGALDREDATNTRFPIALYRLFIGEEQAGVGYERKVLREKKIYTTWNFFQTPIYFTPVYEDYARTDGRIYEYRIDEGKWNAVKEPTISILGLFPGRHQLTVRLLGLSSSETTYQIWVVPSVAFVLEILAILLLLGVGIYFRSYRKKTKVLLDERNIIEQALIEVEDVQNQEEEKLETSHVESKKPVKVNHAEMEKLFLRVDELMKTEKPYLSQDMRLSDLSTAMGVSNAILSNMFKYYLELGYYDYVNGYRLKEFKRYLEEKAYKQYTIIALSEKCGFKKSSFFTTFRKMEGMTPTEYLQKHT